MRRTLALSLLALILVSATAVAAENAGNSVPDQLARAVATLQEKFNSGDAAALAACWTADGDFIGPSGERLAGHDTIEKEFLKFFGEQSGHKIQLRISDVRPLTDNTALVDLIVAMQPPREDVEGTPLSTVVFVKQEERWLIASFRETVVSTPGESQHLKDLAWLVGDWTDTTARDSGVTIHGNCGWAGNGSFLIRKFSVEHPNNPPLRGTEVIGWDPRAHRVRSWTFNADGSFGESTWTRDGNQWIIKYQGVLPDGGDVSATHVLTQTDADTLTLESKNRLLNGQHQADVAPVTVKRTTVAPAAPSQPVKPQKLLP